MALSAYRGVQVGFEPCTSKIEENQLTTRATIKYFTYFAPRSMVLLSLPRLVLELSRFIPTQLFICPKCGML